MKVFTKVHLQMTEKIGEYILVSEKSYEYAGPIAKCDRWAQGQEKNLANQAGTVAGQAGTNATSEESQLTPFFSQEMHAEHSMDPTQINEVLTNAGAGAGAALGTAEGEANQEAARTRNASGFAKTLDDIARQREKTGAGISEGVAAADVSGALKLRQEGASGMEHMFDTNTQAQLKAMGQQSEDVMNEVQASQTGWLQNLEQGIKTADQTALTGAKIASMA